MSLLREEFLKSYPDFPSHMENLAKLVYYRTYSRWLPEEGRRETWKETCARAVEYNCSLAPTSAYEAQRLFDNMFNLKQFISGRSLWIGGSEASKKTKLANFNCSFVVIDSIKSLCDLFYLLMVGTGVGVRILPSDVKELPCFRQNVILHHQYNKHSTKQKGRENTCVETDGDMRIIHIGDSKEGWVDALKAYLLCLVEPDAPSHIMLDYTEIRVKGATLSNFGGTASGYESIMDMFTKIHRVIQEGLFSSKPVNGKLRPIHCLDICNLIGQNVVVGGVRRTAEIAIIDPHDEECVHAKDNIQPGMEHRYMSNNSIFQEEKPSREKIHELFNSIRNSGEPGIINVAEAKRRRADFAGTNPCFLGDMRLLTSNGYIPIGELDGRTDIEIVSNDGTVSIGKVWKSGNKECISLKLSDNSEIKCTPNHVFMDTEGNEVEAKDMLFNRIMPFLSIPNNTNETFVKLGFAQGDGCLSDLKNKRKKGVALNIGEKDADVAKLFGFNPEKGRIYYTLELTDSLEKLQFSPEKLPNRTLPKTIWDWADIEQLSFLRGLYSANGCVIKHGNNIRVGFKTTCKKLAIELVSLLAEFNIHAYITVNKAKYVQFENGEYLCRESYDVNIQQYQSKLLFYNLIGFIQSYKADALYDGLIKGSPKIKGIKQIGVHPVYDFTEPKNHWGVIEGYIAHNCCEIILPPNAVCNLTTVNMVAFADKQGNVDWDGLEEAFILSARAGYRMTCVDLELEGWNVAHHRDRLTGCSMTGWQDFIAKMSNNTFVRAGGKVGILKWLRTVVHEAGEDIASELKTPVPLLMTALKPEGSLSLVANGVSPGVHWQHSPYFIRRIRVNAHDPLALTAKELGWQIHPEVGQDMETATTLVIDFPVHSPSEVTKADIPAVEQLKEYILFQKFYTDMNTSNTITVKPDEWEEVEDFVYNHWDDMLGVTFLELNSTYYPLMPYEECSKEEYEELKSKMKPFDPDLLNAMELSSRNMGKEFEILDDRAECSQGVCPIR